MPPPPPRGEFTSLGGEYRVFGELGRNGPLRGNQQITIKGTPSIPETYLSSSVAWGLNLRVG